MNNELNENLDRIFEEIDDLELQLQLLCLALEFYSDGAHDGGRVARQALLNLDTYLQRKINNA